MNFQPSDYLNGLNLNLEEEFNNDLELFSQNDFFNFDYTNIKSEFLSPISPSQDTTKQQIKSQISSTQDEIHQQLPITPQTPQTPQTPNDDKNTAMEDKKRRNTAASARFRIKKKLKEQQMELKSKELQEKVYNLEKKLMTLEMENKCLKKLIIEKNSSKNDELLETIKKRSMDSKPFFEYTK